MNGTPLRVIIVDDSGEVLSALGRIIDKQPDMELIGVASCVDDGVMIVQQLQPDVVVLDVKFLMAAACEPRGRWSWRLRAPVWLPSRPSTRR
jgi:chemotaxis response regulator CheB